MPRYACLEIPRATKSANFADSVHIKCLILMQVILIADFSLPLAFVISALYRICFNDLVDGVNR